MGASVLNNELVSTYWIPDGLCEILKNFMFFSFYFN